MTEIWIHSRKQPVARVWGTVDSARARTVAAELNARGYKVRLLHVSV